MNCFQSLEVAMVRKQVLRLVSYPIWLGLTPSRLRQELRERPRNLRDRIEAIQLKDKQMAANSTSTQPTLFTERTFLPGLVSEFLDLVANTHPSTLPDAHKPFEVPFVRYAERFIELLVDLLAQLPTRRYLRVFLEDKHVITRCRATPLAHSPQGKLFNQLLNRFQFYQRFEIDDQEGTALTQDDIALIQAEKVQLLQRTAFKHFQPELNELALSNISAVEDRDKLSRHLARMQPDRLRDLCVKLQLLPEPVGDEPANSPDFMIEAIVSCYERRLSQVEEANRMSLYPDEHTLWDENTVPSTQFYTGDKVLALPKLNLQFLTFHDYLLRNFELFRLESMFEIRSDVEDMIKRMKPLYDETAVTGDRTSFEGWSRMALNIKGSTILHVSPPLLGETVPAQVVAEIQYSLYNTRGVMRDEWEAIRQHDVVFMLTVKASIPKGNYNDPKKNGQENGNGKKRGAPDGKGKSKKDEAPFQEQWGIISLRGAEVVEIADEHNHVLKDVEMDIEGKRRAGNKRLMRVRLDPAQYYKDTVSSGVGVGFHSGPDGNLVRNDEGEWHWGKGDKEQDTKPKDKVPTPPVYKTFNILLRRKPKENNFKAVLQTIRELMNSRTVVPPWIHDIFLGYGDPEEARRSVGITPTIDFVDTFVSYEHLQACFPGKKIILEGDAATVAPPFRITFVGDADDDNASEHTLRVNPYSNINMGPYPMDKPKANHVPFTPVQIEAIRSGVNPGLTMVVGPPGTGKTDVAVQIISNLYHTFPNQRTLLVTHSNQALNQLFEKIMALDIDERHLLRLGHGETELETDKDFSKVGRVNYMLDLRLRNLAEVERLARSLNVPGDVGYTCETAAHFNLFHVIARWEVFQSRCNQTAASGPPPPTFIAENFPFTEFFSNAPQPLFGGADYASDAEVAHGCFRHLAKMFTELEECRAFELLRTTHDRANYLLTKQAKIIAMTCTHAALKRGDLVSLGFKYDTLLMEEAAQILEIETFIPMLLQDADEKDGSRLKRCVLIGDHHQLPPVVKNIAFQKYSHLDQSLFARFIRLGVPHIQLDKQGRARESIADLYRWRYTNLGNLPGVLAQDYRQANPGFAYDYQLVDVPDYEGQGESEPSSFFYQNLGEAEYVVLIYMYMRLIGYPAERISIITTYNGQKALIRDVVEQRCARNPMFGRPHKISTVDRFQGQQNDYILLSLVRTSNVGHLRDVRRLVVALSRARLGLYVFCRRSLFENCYELTNAFGQFSQRPDKLMLVKHEQFPSATNPAFQRGVGDAPPEVFEVQDIKHMSTVVYQSPEVIAATTDNTQDTQMPDKDKGPE
eukprot:TRINITY_DN4066_c0_g1_i3.p1 TRINITY_DN4066_c0_g1~~TRINITY_DN4066_c0_g1_i3.p1  ORF type:complete len:1486 (-),score=430.72 TRINITY_DN4066_c0_g1_i3:35-3970(-)